MKKTLWLISLLFAVILIVSGCDSGGGSDDDDYSAPEVMDVSELPASGATSAPTTDAEVIETYSDIYDGIQNILQASGSDSLKAAFNRRARATETEETPISYEDEHMKYTGMITTTSKSPDKGWQPEMNTTYDNLVSMTSVGTITGTITEATVTGESGATYIVSGETAEYFDAGMNVDVKVGTSMETTTFDMDLSIKIASGVAISFRDTVTNVGGKLIISYGFNFAENNLAAESMDDMSVIQDSLEDSKVSIKLYDDTGALVRTIETTLKDMPNSLNTGDDYDDYGDDYEDSADY